MQIKMAPKEIGRAKRRTRAVKIGKPRATSSATTLYKITTKNMNKIRGEDLATETEEKINHLWKMRDDMICQLELIDEKIDTLYKEAFAEMDKDKNDDHDVVISFPTKEHAEKAVEFINGEFGFLCNIGRSKK